MRTIKRSTRDAKIVAMVIGLFVTGLISSLWVFHVFLGGLGNTNLSTPATFAYGFIYMVFSVIAYRTILYNSLDSYEESFVLFNVIPGSIIAVVWLIILRFF